MQESCALTSPPTGLSRLLEGALTEIIEVRSWLLGWWCLLVGLDPKFFFGVDRVGFGHVSLALDPRATH